MAINLVAWLAEYERIVGDGSVDALLRGYRLPSRTTETDLRAFRRTFAKAVEKYCATREMRSTTALKLAAEELADRLASIREFMGDDNYRAMMEELALRQRSTQASLQDANKAKE